MTPSYCNVLRQRRDAAIKAVQDLEARHVRNPLVVIQLKRRRRAVEQLTEVLIQETKRRLAR